MATDRREFGKDNKSVFGPVTIYIFHLKEFKGFVAIFLR